MRLLNKARARFVANRHYWLAVAGAKRLESGRVGFRLALERLVPSARRGATTLTSFFTGSLIWNIAGILSTVVLCLLDELPCVRTMLAGRKPSCDGYLAALQTVASISGVFIGLHFSGLGSIAGTSYSKISEVRNLLFEEERGAWYVRLLTYVTTLSFSLLCYYVYVPNVIGSAVIAMWVLALPSMVAFTKMARLHMHLLSPSHIAPLGAGRVMVEAHSAATSRLRNSPTFQQGCRARADMGIRILEALTSLYDIDNVVPEGTVVNRLAETTLTVLASYIDIKQPISPTSHWFERRARYPRWYLSDQSRLSLAIQTATSLRPEDEPDFIWVERRLVSAIDAVLHVLVAKHRAADVAKLCIHFNSSFRNLGKQLDVFYADKLLSHFWDAIKPSIHPFTEASLEHRLLLADQVSLLPLAVWASLCMRLDELKIQIERTAKSIRERNNKASPLPSILGREISAMREAMEFEYRAEGSVITPAWQLDDHLRAAVLRIANEAFRTLSSWAAKFYIDFANDFTNAGMHAEATMIVSRGFEYVHKYRHRLPQILSTLASLQPSHNQDQYNIAILTNADIENTLLSAMRQLEQRFAAAITLVSKVELDSSLPDLFGEALHRTGEILFSQMETGDTALDKSSVEAYFSGILNMVGRIAEEVRERDEITRFFLTHDPFFDLVALTGFAAAWSELHQRSEMFQPWRELWDRYLGTDLNRHKHVSRIIREKQRAARMSPRDVTQTEWLQRFSSAVRALSPEGKTPPSPFGSYPGVDHPSPLVRVYGRGPHVSFGGLELFVSQYVLQSAARAADFGKDHLTESIEREQRWQGP